jgi:hypothetical protein
MTQHTTGNWNWHTSNSWKRLCSDQGHGKQVPILTPTVNPRDGHDELDVSSKDMALISAAPDLLAALRRLLAKSTDMLERDFTAQWRRGDELSEEVAQAESAIAKAEGR